MVPGSLPAQEILQFCVNNAERAGGAGLTAGLLMVREVFSNLGSLLIVLRKVGFPCVVTVSP